MDDVELISARAAARLLGRGPALPRSQAIRVLGSGLAGEPVRTAHGLLFQAAAVRELAGRPVIEEGELRRLHLPVLAVGRRQVDVNQPPATLREGLCQGWDLHIGHCVALTWRVEQTGPIPLVATVAGFVQAGAEITGAGAALSPALFRLGRGDARLRLQPPGDWYERVRGLRLMTGPGRPFTTYDWDLSSAVRVA